MICTDCAASTKPADYVPLCGVDAVLCEDDWNEHVAECGVCARSVAESAD